MEKILEKIGLAKNEAKIYTSLLELGPSNAGTIIKKTGIHRAGVYDALERLIKKGLISFMIKDHKKYFEPVSPKQLLNLLEIKEKKIQEEKKELSDIIPLLEKKVKVSSEAQEVTLFKGIKGIKSILDDWVSEDKEILVMGAYSEESKSFHPFMEYIFPNFHKRRMAKKIPMRFIFPKQSIKRALQLKKMKYTKVRILPSSFVSIVATQIYKDKVAITVWSEDPIGLIIRNKEVAKNQKDYFNFLWEKAKKI